MTAGVNVDLIGRRYGLLTIIRYAGQNRHHQSMWMCRCECGTEKVICGNTITKGQQKSCGGAGCRTSTRRTRIPGSCNRVPGWTVQINPDPFRPTTSPPEGE